MPAARKGYKCGVKRFAAAVSLLAFFFTSVRSPAAPSDDAQLRALESTFAKAFAAKDVSSLMSVYAPGSGLFVFDVVGPPGTYHSWDAYRDAFQHLFAMLKGPVHFTISDLDVEASGDLGYGRSLQHVSATRANGEPYDVTVRVTDVYRKIGGKWLIVQEHVSLPLDRETFKPLVHG